jgi:regulator of sigma E protease
MSVLLFLVILVVLVLVHELGHFFVAKLFHVRVEEFGIGYPPRAFTLGRLGDTEYTINWVPFGGFVRLLGEDKGSALPPSEKRVSFIYSAWYKKAAILVAGVICNILLGVVLFSFAASYGAPVTIDEDSYLAPKARMMITQVYQGTPAESAGFKAGDIVTNVHTTKDELKDIKPSTFAAFTGAHGGQRMMMTVVREGKEESLDVAPAQNVLEGDASTPAIGVSLGFVLQERVPLYQTIPIGVREAKDWFIQVAEGLWALIAGIFTGESKIGDVSGPVGIAVHVGEWYQLGIAHLLYFVGIISVNLAVINLIPIPALDGGRLLFVLIERVIRRDIPEVYANALNTVGFLAIIALMIVVTYNDIFKLVTG